MDPEFELAQESQHGAYHHGGKVIKNAEGLASGIDNGIVRFCPICDGFEAMDHRIGVFGSGAEVGRKALFLRTYSRNVTVFDTRRESAPMALQQMLQEDGIALAGKPTRTDFTDRAVTVTVERGARIDLDVLYPAMGCQVRSDLAAALGLIARAQAT